MMGIDGIAVRGLQRELDRTLAGARVTKIYQPMPDTLSLRLRRPTREYDLVCSSHARFARVHITQSRYSNPVTPPPFCMLLRKHLEGARLVAVEQPGLERAVRFIFEPVGAAARDADVRRPDGQDGPGTGAVVGRQYMGATLVLVVELMGRHSNVILMDGVSGRILDGMKRISSGQSRYREVAPGEPYLPAPPQGKRAPEDWTFDELDAAIRHAPTEARLWEVFVHRVDGVGPTVAQAILRHAGVRPNARRSDLDSAELAAAADAVWGSWREFVALLAGERYVPTLLVQRDTGSPVDLLPFAFGIPADVEVRAMESFSALFDTLFGHKVAREQFQRQAHTLEQYVQAALKRVRRRLKAQQRDMEATAEMERYRLYGELLTANLYRIQTDGASGVVVPNYYDPEQSDIEIPLDPQKTPSENAQAYFKRYSKLKKRSEQLGEQIAQGEAESRYLESLLTHVALADSTDDLEALRQELRAEGYVTERGRGAGSYRGSSSKQRSKATADSHRSAGRPSRFRSSDGYVILVGRNNRQNDRLTLRTGRPDDLWLHTKEIPGSHVLIRADGSRAEAIPERTVDEAAVIAAYFSKGRDSVNVPVDVTERRHVRKPTGAKPGMVIYDHHHTKYVTPDAALVARLREAAGSGADVSP